MVEEPVTFVPFELLVNLELPPYVRMTQRSMYVNKYAKNYVSVLRQTRPLIKDTLDKAGVPMFGDFFVPERTPFAAFVYVFTERVMHKCDLDNLVKAALDLTQGVVFKNDSYCDAIIASRHKAAQPLLRIFFSPWFGSWE